MLHGASFRRSDPPSDYVFRFSGEQGKLVPAGRESIAHSHSFSAQLCAGLGTFLGVSLNSARDFPRRLKEGIYNMEPGLALYVFTSMPKSGFGTR